MRALQRIRSWRVGAPGRRAVAIAWSALCAGAVTMGGPAAAQDILFDIGPTSRCVAWSETDAEYRSCAGLAADACMGATVMGGSTVGTRECLSRELAWWDDRLNRAYGFLRSEERGEDAEMAEMGLPQLARQAEALRDMQRAWIAFRDATCDYERAQWGGGTGGGPAAVGCQMRMTAYQTLYLERALRDR